MPKKVKRLSEETLKFYDKMDTPESFDHLFNVVKYTTERLYNLLLIQKDRRNRGRDYSCTCLRDIRLLTLNLKDLGDIYRKKSVAWAKNLKAARNERKEIKNRIFEEQGITRTSKEEK